MENTKFFRNGKTFSAFCRMRYGKSKMIWDDTTLWKKVGKYAIEFDIEAADKKFQPETSFPVNEEDTSFSNADEESFSQEHLEWTEAMREHTLY